MLQWWGCPTTFDEAVGQQGKGGHSVQITNRQAGVCIGTNPSWNSSGCWVDCESWVQLRAFAHSCNVGISLLNDLLHIFEFNVVSCWVLVVLGCRDYFCYAAKSNGERGTVKVLHLHYIVIEVEYHTGGGDQLET